MLFLAFKQLFSKKKQTFLILLGVSFGTMLFVSISGVQLGFREYMIKALLNNTAHIIISGADNEVNEKRVRERIFSSDQLVSWITPPSGKRDESKLENYPGWVQILKASPDVYDFSPRLSIHVMLKRGSVTSNLSLVGSLPRRQLRISDLSDYIVEGKFENLASGGNKVVLGIGVAKDLGVRVGQFVDIISGENDAIPFKVVGLSKFGDDRTDKSLAFAHLADVQKLNRTPGRVSEVAVALNDIDKSEELAQLWSMFSRDKVEDWKSASKMFMEMIKMQDIVRFFIMFSVLIVAAFGIYNVLSIMINQKKKEIAILRSVGYGPQKILELIMYQGFFLGFSGGLLGMLMGFLVTYGVGSIDIGFELGGSNHMLVSYDRSIYFAAFTAAVFASLLASIIPAYSASKMTPIDIIRGQ
ncbi:MAG: permease [Bdellovibrionaceae bacterium]|nr:permease [Pseudobdellovibrionaceae bacterium]|tara:strand:+ start:1152 stop:2393 length:1242 start_codon:yes stop_codon:yes gene_type:complete